MILAPSVLSADFGCLERSIDMINHSEAQWVHCDVMDGVFVPNISFGFPVIKAIRKLTSKVIDVHMMTIQPERYVNAVRDCGADIMNVHFEACTHLHRTIELIHQAGMKAAVTLNPATPVCSLTEIINDVDMVLLMSVDPGFGGQSFIGSSLEKIRRLSALRQEASSNALIQVDGGINKHNCTLCKVAGADVLVAGSSVFGAPDPITEIYDMVNC